MHQFVFKIIKLVLISSLLLTTACSKKSASIQPEKGNIVEAIYGLGVVVSDQSYHVKAGIPLSVDKVFVREGDKVKVGQPLLEYENRSVIKSPLAGTVVKKNIDEAEIATPQVSLVEIQNLDDLYVEVALEQQSIIRIRKRQPVRVSFESARGQFQKSEVAAVYPREQNFIVRFNLPKKIEGILPGMTADVAIEVGRKKDVWLIPLKAVKNGHVVMNQGKGFKKVSVEIGVMDGVMAEILAPELNGSEKVKLD